MGVALYIATKKKLKGFDPFVNGKAVGACDEQAVDALCEQLGVPALSSFVSQDPDEIDDFMESEGMDFDEGVEPPKEEWFEADAGLRTVRALVGHLAKEPKALPNGTSVLEDLREYESVLVELAKRKVRWHFAWDV